VVVSRLLKAAKYLSLLQLVGATLVRSTSGFVLLLFSILAAGLMFGAAQFYAENLSLCAFNESDQTWYYVDGSGASPYQSVLDGTYWAIVYVSICFAVDVNLHLIYISLIVAL
jgi:hypothetical protein